MGQFQGGPSGGGSINVMCAWCGHWYNNTIVSGMDDLHRIQPGFPGAVEEALAGALDKADAEAKAADAIADEIMKEE